MVTYVWYGSQVSGDSGLSPTLQTMTIIMQYYAKLPDLESTETMFKSMTEEHEIQPDARSYMVTTPPTFSSSLSLLYPSPHHLPKSTSPTLSSSLSLSLFFPLSL